MSRLCWLMAAGVGSVLAANADAQDVRMGVEVAPRIGYSNNTFQDTGDGHGTAIAELAVRPEVRLVSEHTIWRLNGDANVRAFSHEYNTTDGYRAALDYTLTPSAASQAHATVSFESAIIGARDVFFGDPPSGPGTQPGDDLALFGTRDRRTRLAGSADYSSSLSDRMSVNGNVFYDRTRYRTLGNLGNYNGIGGGIGLSRRFDDYTSVGAQVTVSSYDYISTGRVSRSASLQLTGSRRINAYWVAKGALGGTLVDPGRSAQAATSVSLSGNLSLCREGGRSNICLTGSRAVRPTGLGRLQFDTTIDANYSRRITERTTATANIGFSQSAGQTFGTVTDDKFYRATVGLDRNINRRLRANASVFYRKLDGIIFTHAPDFGGNLGLTYRFGDSR